MRAYLLLLLLLIPLVYAHTNDTAQNSTATDTCGPSEPGEQGNWKPFLVLGVGIALIVFTAYTGVPWKLALNILAVLLIIGGMWLLWVSLEINSDSIHFGAPGSTHEHADFQLMVNNQIVDLTDERYLSTSTNPHSRYVHLHHIDNVVHVHATNVTWAYFFKSINVPVDDQCLRLSNQSICSGVFIVNGTRINTLNTPIHDGDRALFHYGGGNATKFFNEAVGNESCLYSHTCPERGEYTDCAVTDK